MENAADALQMAAAVLIFVVALTISINAFSQARSVSSEILDYNDREYDYTYVEENLNADGTPTTERIVFLESIVPSIYKAYKENYKIVFDDDGDTSNINASNILGNDGIYRVKDDSGNDVPVYTIDLQNEVLGNDTQKEQFIMSILYGKRYKAEDGTSLFDAVKDRFRDNLGIYLNDEGIYDKIKENGTGKGLKERLGIYYQGETPSQGGTTDTSEDASSVPNNNKTIKRVVTYSIPN